MADQFETFWRAYPKRPVCRDKMTARMLWGGKKPLNDGSFITPDMHEAIIEGARAYAELAASNEFRWNECRWLRAAGWETAIEELAEQREEEQRRQEREDTQRSRDRQFTREYTAWRNQRGLIDTPENLAEFRELRRQQQEHGLRVVGGTG